MPAMLHALLTATLLSAAPAAPAAAPPAPAEVLPFIADDYPRALAEARARKLPLFVDVWAPWCHSCLFLRSYVLTDKALAPQAGKFVWLSVDTEKAQNAPFASKFPIEAWPTLFVIDPVKETAVLRWLGTATAADLSGLLDDGARAVAGTGDAATLRLARADAAEAQGQHAAAAKLYAEALAAGGPKWAQAARVLQSEDFALQEAGDLEGCVKVSRAEAGALPPGSPYANLVATGLQCATSLPAGPARTEAIGALEPLAVKALQIPSLLADDRSGVYETLVDLRESQNDAAGKKALASAWLAFLEGEAAKAKTPVDRAVFDPHRVEAAIALGEPARALPALKQSEKDLPDDYNPAARQALVYLELGKLNEALSANDRALAKVYGPRTLRVLDNRAQIFRKLKRDKEARETLQRAVTLAENLPAGQKNPHAVERLKKQLAELAPKG
jgi:thioredoxin-like negative regulator of GroEL